MRPRARSRRGARARASPSPPTPTILVLAGPNGVAERVRRGGHGIAEDVVRRRYLRGLRNFFTLYMSVADHWVLSDNTGASLALIAQGGKDRTPTIHEPHSFQEIQKALRAGQGPEG